MAIQSANTIPTNKHVLVCGMTGTGKSYLCEQYLSRYDYVVKLDTKDETTERQMSGISAWDGLEENKDFTIVRNIDLLDDVETKKIIYAPPYDEQNEETFNRFFKWCFDRGNTIVWVDELMSIGTVHKYPRELGRLMHVQKMLRYGVVLKDRVEFLTLYQLIVVIFSSLIWHSHRTEKS